MSKGTAKPKTEGAIRAGDGHHLFDLKTAKPIKAGADYSTSSGAVVEGDRMMVGLMRMPKGTGAAPHSHPNEQWVFVMEGEFESTIDGETHRVKPGSVLYIPANAVHSGKAVGDHDLVFFTCKDTSHSIHGIKI